MKDVAKRLRRQATDDKMVRISDETFHPIAKLPRKIINRKCAKRVVIEATFYQISGKYPDQHQHEIPMSCSINSRAKLEDWPWKVFREMCQ